MPGIETMIADDGEVLLRGPIITPGYHNLPDITAEAFTDGWYHTGDLGEFDARGNLTITDRKKDLFKTSGGKYIAPQKVERRSPRTSPTSPRPSRLVMGANTVPPSWSSIRRCCESGLRNASWAT